MIGDIQLSDTPLPDKEWHQHLEGMLNTGQLNPDIIPYLDSYQWYCINEIKKTFKRISYRHAREINKDTEGVESTEGSV